MNAQTVREFLRRKPFQSFVIRMSNGEVHEIRHPECVLLLKSHVIVGYADEDRTFYRSMIHIHGVEALQVA